MSTGILGEPEELGLLGVYRKLEQANPESAASFLTLLALVAAGNQDAIDILKNGIWKMGPDVFVREVAKLANKGTKFGACTSVRVT